MTGGYRRVFQKPMDFEWYAMCIIRTSSSFEIKDSMEVETNFVGNCCRELLTYTDSNKPLAETDLDRITMEKPVDKVGSAEETEDESIKSDTNPPKSCETDLKDQTDSKKDDNDTENPNSEQTQLALKMALTLPSSCYATMAIRELLKTSTSVSTKTAISMNFLIHLNLVLIRFTKHISQHLILPFRG